MRHFVKFIVLISLLTAGDRLFGQLNVTLTSSNHNGYNISCFGSRDGSISTSVTGGQPPYTYRWSTNETASSISNLAAGYYSVTVTDNLNASAQAQVTLTQPDKLDVLVQPYEYPNQYNISCYNCFNGSIDVTVSGGVTPYTYLWKDGATTQDRSSCGARDYSVTVTDNNGCSYVAPQVTLREPARIDWTMNGNLNTNPGTHFLGTSDNKDLVLKTNGQERLRLKSDGNVSLTGSLAGSGLLFRDSNGILKIYDGVANPAPTTPCSLGMQWPFWGTSGNNATTCDGCSGFLGTIDNCALNLGTDGKHRFRGHLKIVGASGS